MQYLRAGERFQGIEAGMAVPLCFGAQAARVKAAGLNKQIAETDLKNQEIQLQFRPKLPGKSATPAAKALLFTRARCSSMPIWPCGKPTKLTATAKPAIYNYLQAADQLLRIQQNYLQLLLDHRLNLYQLEYLKGK